MSGGADLITLEEGGERWPTAQTEGAMNLTDREFWGIVHGMGLGTLYLLAFGGGLAGLWSLRPNLLTAEGAAERMPRLKVGLTIMAIAAWLTVLTGTWIVYPWYRAGSDATCKVESVEAVPVECGAKYVLLADASTEQWHEFAMEWKEHAAWIVPLIATAVAFSAAYLGRGLLYRNDVRVQLMWFLFASFALAVIAGLLGALITKSAPVL
jgi:hypothetical protein